MANVTSRDGTKIAYEVTGRGPAVIFVNGAMAFRDFYGNRDLANELIGG